MPSNIVVLEHGGTGSSGFRERGMLTKRHRRWRLRSPVTCPWSRPGRRFYTSSSGRAQ